MQTPRDVTGRVLAALDAGDWAAVAALVDSEAAELFKQEHARSYRTELAMRDPTVLAEAPEAFRNFMQETQGRRRRTMTERIFHVTRTEEFDALPARTVVERFLSIKHPGPRGELRQVQAILGEVMDGPDVAHVVIRRSNPFGVNRIAWDTVDVLSLRRREEGWRCALNGGLVYDSGGGWGIGMSDDDEAPAG